MNKKQSVLLQRTYIILVFCFMYLPIAVMIAFSFNESKSRSNFTGFTLGWYKSLFHNEMILSALGLSLVLALVSSVVATVLGTSTRCPAKDSSSSTTSAMCLSSTPRSSPAFR